MLLIDWLLDTFMPLPTEEELRAENLDLRLWAESIDADLEKLGWARVTDSGVLRGPGPGNHAT